MTITPRHRLRLDGTHAWQVTFRVGRKQTSKTFDDPKIAARFAKLIDEQGVDGALAVLDAWDQAGEDSFTVGEWCEHHIENLSGVQPGTISHYRGYIRMDLKTITSLPLEGLTPEVIARWVNARAKAGYSGKSIANAHGFLSAAMNRAVRAGHIPSNPCKGTRIPKTVTEPMVFLTHDEYARFIGYFPPRWVPLAAFLFATGLRWGEATALRVSDVDLEAATVTVHRAWKRGRIVGVPKTSKSLRTVSLAPETVDVLKPLVVGRPGDAWLFVNMRDRPVQNATFHEQVWDPAVRLANGQHEQAPPKKKGGRVRRVAPRLNAAGKRIEPAKVPLGKWPRVHDARHTNASWLLGAGVPINYVQAHLGHESITTTVDRYGHTMPMAKQMVAAAMSQALTAGHPQIEG